VTQQNAALVEQAAAAAEAMQEQANALSAAVSVFKLEGIRGGTRTAIAKPVAYAGITHSASRTLAPLRTEHKLVKTKVKSKSIADKDGDWKEF